MEYLPATVDRRKELRDDGMPNERAHGALQGASRGRFRGVRWRGAAAALSCARRRWK
ncbi:hypothetical protein GCM10010271_70980 [Streptomyces kurssanovii]|nr:hypothetical protein GCM10010271_70980 [Streptomyces kurssanovii]